MCEVELVKDDLGHHADTGPKVAQSVAEVLSADLTGDRWAPRVFFLLRRLVEYGCATLFCEFDDLRRGQWSLVVDDVLDIASIG